MAVQKIERIDEIPLILHWLMTMRTAEFIDTIWQTHGNWQGLSYGQLTVLLITYIVHSLTHRLSGMEDWVQRHREVLEEVTGWTIGTKDATDDRLGAMLGVLGGKPDHLAAFQRHSGRHLIQAYALPTEVARYDTTSFNVHHDASDNDHALLRFGHSKDRRPDLLQFKQGLGVLDPAGVPIFTETLAGNAADDPQYVPAWRAMAQTIGHTHFLYVADSKAGALETRASIDREGGIYLFPVPRTGTVPDTLQTLVTTTPSSALTPISLETTGDDASSAPLVGRGFEVDKRMTFGEGDDQHVWNERWLIVRSDAHAARQNTSLTTRLVKAEQALAALTPKKTETAEQVQVRAERLLVHYAVTDCFHVQVNERVEQKKRSLKRGRPTPATPYELVDIRRLSVEVRRNTSVIEAHQRLAGWRIYVSNTPSERLSLQQSVRYYRDEWRVERGMHRLKRGSLPALPLLLRLPERITGLMLVLSIALQVVTLMEFVARRNLAQHGDSLVGLVPGNPRMKTAHPTTERLLAQFDELHVLIDDQDGDIVGRLVETLTPLQRQILALLEIPVDIYDVSFRHSNHADIREEST